MNQATQKLSSIALSMAATFILAGCGGGSTNTSPTTNNVTNNTTNVVVTGQPAIDNVITQMTSTTNAMVSWWGGTMGGVTSAQAEVSTLMAAVTAGSYNAASTRKAVTLPGTWANVPGTATFLRLTSAGWSSANTFVNNGNGTISNNGASATIETTDLSGGQVICTFSNKPVASGATAQTCPVSTTYPAGSLQIKTATTTTSDSYALFDLSAMPSSIADQSGVLLTALPAAGATFCLADGPNMQSNVWAAKVPAPAAGNDNYNLYSVASCTAGNISAAMAAAATSSALVSTTATGLGGVTVLSMKRTVVQGTFNNIAAFNGAKFLTGSVTPAGIQTAYTVNKTAANAQLAAHSLPALP